MNESKKEILFAAVAGFTALAAILAMPVLVASPKLLFGRSLSAISPSLFPYVTLSLIAFLSAALCIVSFTNIRLKQTRHSHESETIDESSVSNENEENNSTKKTSFFLLLLGYGLLLKPIGFFISSSIVITLASLLLGNRHWIQITLLAVIAPVCLYLIATRGMLVSLPELNTIELFYSRLIEWIRGAVSA